MQEELSCASFLCSYLILNFFSQLTGHNRDCPFATCKCDKCSLCDDRKSVNQKEKEEKKRIAEAKAKREQSVYGLESNSGSYSDLGSVVPSPTTTAPGSPLGSMGAANLQER